MRGYVEALEAAHKYGVDSLNDTERALLRVRGNESAVAAAELDLILLPEKGEE